MRNILEIKRTVKDNIEQGGNVVFNTASPYSEGITYDPVTGEIILTEIGQYSIKWWVATETSLTGCIQFALKSSQGDELIGCSPTKRGQVVGFGEIYARSENVTLSLVNMGTCQVIPSQTSPVTAALLAMRIPEDSVPPTFEVDKVETLEPGETATVNVWEDDDNPNNWLFSFGIPKGETGAQGDTPYIDADTGNWFIGDEDSGVQARGPQGPAGPSAATIPFSISKHGVHLSIDAQGEPLAVSFSGFGGNSYDSPTYLQEGEWATGTITIREETYFGTTFIMPRDAKLKKVHALFSTEWSAMFDEGATIRPFVCLAVSNSDDLVYSILQDSITFTEPYAGGIEFPRHTVRRGNSGNLNIEITEGTLVAIVAGFIGENVTHEQSASFSGSGGLYLE